MSALQTTITEATKTAMKARDKQRVGVLRLINSEIKRYEVDERKEPTDEVVLDILNRMKKQRNDSIKAYTEAARDELVAQEAYEITVLQEYMPEQLDDDAIKAIVSKAIADTGAAGMKDMGKVMGVINAPLKGRADMGAVSALVKGLLG